MGIITKLLVCAYERW